MWDLSSTHCQGSPFSFILFCVQHLLLFLPPFFALEPNLGDHNNPDTLCLSEPLFSAERHNKIIKQNRVTWSESSFYLDFVLRYYFIRLLLILSLTFTISLAPLRQYFEVWHIRARWLWINYFFFPQCPQLKCGHNSRWRCLIRILWRLWEIMHVKHLEERQLHLSIK